MTDMICIDHIDMEIRPTRATTLRAPHHRSRGAKRTKILLKLLAAATAVVAGYGAYDRLLAVGHVRTDDAHVGANIADIAPLIGGPVKDVLVNDTQSVKRGDILVRLDDTDARIALARAEAKLIESERHVHGPAAAGRVGISDANVDVNPEVATARAERDQARINLARTIITAPIDGVVSRRDVQIGQRVQPGATLMVIDPIARAYVDATFKEIQLAQVRPGQPVTLVSDLYGGRVKYHGRVAGVAGETASAFAKASSQDATSRRIKVVQRLPVRIELDPRELVQHPLEIGLSMDADIDTDR